MIEPRYTRNAPTDVTIKEKLRWESLVDEETAARDALYRAVARRENFEKAVVLKVIRSSRSALYEHEIHDALSIYVEVDEALLQLLAAGLIVEEERNRYSAVGRKGIA